MHLFAAEIALAAGAIPVSLCGTKTIPSRWRNHAPAPLPADQEQFRFRAPRQLSLISPPDIVVADTTCDGKKKMYNRWPPTSRRTAPASADSGRDAKTTGAHAALAARLEKDFGVSITTDDLRMPSG
ncbi:MAG: 2-hydroxyacyl-CoA dehydratase [Bilophila wadsworthia]